MERKTRNRTQRLTIVGLALSLGGMACGEGGPGPQTQPSGEKKARPTLQTPGASEPKRASLPLDKALALGDHGKQALSQIVSEAAQKSPTAADQATAATEKKKPGNKRTEGNVVELDGPPKLSPRPLLEVSQLSFARAVDKREPRELSDSFQADGQRVFAHLRLNSELSEGNVQIVFKRFDREYYRAKLRVGKSPRWRTWASISATPKNAGSWTVDVEDESGKLLASRKFAVNAVVDAPATDEAAEKTDAQQK